MRNLVRQLCLGSVLFNACVKREPFGYVPTSTKKACAMIWSGLAESMNRPPYRTITTVDLERLRERIRSNRYSLRKTMEVSTLNALVAAIGDRSSEIRRCLASGDRDELYVLRVTIAGLKPYPTIVQEVEIDSIDHKGRPADSGHVRQRCVVDLLSNVALPPGDGTGVLETVIGSAECKL